MTDFSTFLEPFSESEPMPLLHSTSSYNFRDIARDPSPKLTPTDCPVFGEPLLYLFYGRPAYRVTDKDSDNLAYAPVCFVLRPEAVSTVERVFPFDTGAFKHGKFAPFVHDKMTKESFQIGADLTAARKAVTAFFGSTRRYYIGQLSNSLVPKFSEMELATFVQIVSRPPAGVVDDRRYSIEIQTNSSVSLVGNTLAVVLPHEAMDDINIRSVVVDKLGAQPITYYSMLGVRPSDFHGEIRLLVQQFLEREGYLT